MGLWRGKKGSSVFYYLRNSKDAQKQGIRERVYQVSNPQTRAQLLQRLKVSVAQNTYRVLQEVLRRSWEGKEYGGKGTQEYMKYALSMSEGFPYLNKGDTRAFPGSYKIANGSLPQVIPSISGTVANLGLDLGNLVGTEDTYGTVSQALIDIAGLQAGDQVTIVTCMVNGRDLNWATAQPMWSVDSFYIDPENQEDSFEDTVFIANNRCSIAASNGQLALSQTDYWQFVAIGVIISRLGDNGKYLRSPATLVCEDGYLEYFNTVVRKGICVDSYRKTATATRSTNWPVDTRAEATGSSSREKIESTYTLTGLTGDMEQVNGTQVRVQRYADDNQLAAVYVKSSSLMDGAACVVKTNNTTVTYDTAGGLSYDLEVSQVPALASLPQISLD